MPPQGSFKRRFHCVWLEWQKNRLLSFHFNLCSQHVTHRSKAGELLWPFQLCLSAAVVAAMFFVFLSPLSLPDIAPFRRKRTRPLSSYFFFLSLCSITTMACVYVVLTCYVRYVYVCVRSLYVCSEHVHCGWKLNSLSRPQSSSCT